MDEEQKCLSKKIEHERTKFIQYVRRKVTGISQMDAEDIVADVIFNIYNKVDFQHHIENLIAYMYRSIRNKIVDHLRQSRPVLSLDKIDESTGMSWVENMIDPNGDIEMNLQKKEFREYFFAALMKLEPKQRAIWIATEIEGYTFKELSKKWGEPIGTLLSRKSRATKSLKYMLTDLKF